MKKLSYYVAFFMLIMAGNLKADNYREAIDYDAVRVSTVAFSTATVNAFDGPGIIFGWGCSSTSVNTYFEIYNSTDRNLNIQTATINSKPDRLIRWFNYGNEYSTSAVASGDYWLQRPIKVTKGCTWFITDKVNAAWLYYKELP